MAGSADKEYRLRITGDAEPLGRATRQAASQLNDLKREAQGLASAISGGLIGGGIGGVIQFAVQAIGDKIKEARDLIRDAERLKIRPESAAYLRNLEKIGDLEKGTLGLGQKNADDYRGEALSGDPAAVKAFADLGFQLEKIKRLEPEQLFQELLESLGPNASNAQRAAFRKIVGEGVGNSIEELVAGGFFRSERVRSYAGESVAMAASTFNDTTGKLVRSAQTLSTTPLLRIGYNDYYRNLRDANRADLDPLPQFTRDQEAKERRQNLAIQERENALARDRMPIEERLLSLARERDKLLKDAAMEPNGQRSRDLFMRSQELQAQINQIENQQGQGARLSGLEGASRTQSDPYTRVGRYFFGAGASTLKIPEQSLSALRELVRLTQQLPEATGEEVSKRL